MYKRNKIILHSIIFFLIGLIGIYTLSENIRIIRDIFYPDPDHLAYMSPPGYYELRGILRTVIPIIFSLTVLTVINSVYYKKFKEDMNHLFFLGITILIISQTTFLYFSSRVETTSEPKSYFQEIWWWPLKKETK